MNIYQFEIVSTVAEVKSFSKAGKLLHLTQPAISAQVQSIENYYGIQLFERTSQGVKLTKAGKIFYEYALKFLELHENMERCLQQASEQANKELVVGASSTIGNYALPCSIWTFKEKFPDINIRLEIANTREIINRVIQKTVDIGLVDGPVQNKELVALDVVSGEIVLVVPNKGDWKKKESITLEEFCHISLILREEGSGLRQLLSESLRTVGLSLANLRIATEMNSQDAIKSAIEGGLWASVLPRLAVQKELRAGTLKTLAIVNFSMEVNYQVIYPVQGTLTPLAKRFIRFVSAPTERAFC